MADSADARRRAEEALAGWRTCLSIHDDDCFGCPEAVADALRALLAALPDEALTAYCDVCESDRRVPCHSTVTGEVALYPHPERVVAARAAKGGE